LHDDDPVGQEIDAGRTKAFEKGLESIAALHTPDADAVRKRFESLARYRQGCEGTEGHGALYAKALRASRKAILAMRASDDIGDDAFHDIEEELDWLEMALGTDGQTAESGQPDSAMDKAG
jgi:CPA1 family monovalent cation:H+ antiporter